MKDNKMYHTTFDILTIIVLIAAVIICAALVGIQYHLNQERIDIDETAWDVDIFDLNYENKNFAVTAHNKIVGAKRDIDFIITEFTKPSDNYITILEIPEHVCTDFYATPIDIPTHLLAVNEYNDDPEDVYRIDIFGEDDYIVYIFKLEDRYVVSYSKQSSTAANSNIAAYTVFYKEFDFGSKLEKIIDRYTEEVIKG